MSFKKMHHAKNEQSFLWNLKSKIQEHFKNKFLKIHYFKGFSRTTSNSRTIQGIQGIQGRWPPGSVFSENLFMLDDHRGEQNNSKIIPPVREISKILLTQVNIDLSNLVMSLALSISFWIEASAWAAEYW